MRGQVASLVATPEGAKLFANADPPPHAEWLCVFDRNVRYRKPGKEAWDDAVEVDPLEEYGLDDDPPRSQTDNRDEQPSGVDLIAALADEDDDQSYERMSGSSPPGRTGISRRLWWLTIWFGAIAHEPAAVWWALRQRFLHPNLIRNVDRRLGKHGKPFDDKVRRIWSLLLETMDDKPTDPHDLGWFDFLPVLAQDGWTARTLRKFEKVIRPRLSVSDSSPHSLLPPSSLDDSPSKLQKFEVHFPSKHGKEIDIDSRALPDVFRVIRQALECAISLLSETDSQASFFRLPAIEPDERPGDRYLGNNGIDDHFLWVVELFGRLAVEFPEKAKQEALRWPDPDKYFFDKLRIFAWRNRDLFDAHYVANGIIGLSDESFWNANLSREILHLFRARWDDFSKEDRRSIEGKIIAGRPMFEHETAEKHAERKLHSCGEWFGWLERNGCELSERAMVILSEVRANPQWREIWEENADHDTDNRAGSVERRKDAQTLEGVALHEIISAAQERSGHDYERFIEFAPFDGLVQKRPLRAVSALGHEARHGRYPARFWERVFAEWPEGTSDRLVCLLAHRLMRLPSETIFEVRYYAPNWIEEHLASPGRGLSSTFFATWDAVIDGLNEIGRDATQSALGEVRSAGVLVQKSRKSLAHALNSPIGRLVEALFAHLGGKTFDQGEGFPPDVTKRLEVAMLVAGEGAHHAVCMMTQRLNWLYYVDPVWVGEILLPSFKLTSALWEAAWSGCLFAEKVPQPADLFDNIKPDFLALIAQKEEWLVTEDLNQQAARFLTIAAIWNKHDVRYVTNAECRNALQNMNDEGRQASIWVLAKIVSEQDAWASFGIEFFDEIWPQEARFQTSGTSDAMIRIAEANADEFPDIVRTIGEYLRPTDHPDLFVYRQSHSPGKDGSLTPLSERWPLQVLELADRTIADEPTYPPHGLAELLENIADNDPSAKQRRSWRRLHELVST